MSETTSTSSSRIIIRRLQVLVVGFLAGQEYRRLQLRSNLASSTFLHTAAFSRHRIPQVYAAFSCHRGRVSCGMLRAFPVCAAKIFCAIVGYHSISNAAR